MAEKNLDRRQRRSRRLLRDALFALILEKGYDAVTVEEITRRADLGRATFYLHYRDKEDLLLQCLEETADGLAEQIGLLQPARPQEEDGHLQADFSGKSPVLLVFQHAAQNASIYRVILRGEGAYKVSRRIREIASRYAAEFFSARLGYGDGEPRSTIPIEVVANYFAGSLLGMLTWWLESGMPYSPEQMSETFRQLLFQGLRQVIRPEGE
ncbi:MAG: TetR/AcrR family transcriptional regulator [Anaerolineae bacterium]|nr:TetR/AcrR family transcriptional regulator [Anaerolineae bacterium]